MAPAIELLGTYLIVLGWDYLPQEVQFGSGRRVLVPKLERQRPLLLRTAPPRLETKARVWDLPLLTVVRPLGLSGVSFREENGTKTDLTRPFQESDAESHCDGNCGQGRSVPTPGNEPLSQGIEVSQAQAWL